MRRRIQGLHEADQSTSHLHDGLLLVRVERVHHRWDSRKAFYLLRFSILGPKELTGHSVTGRLYCTPRALWKLNWFLRDFGYDTELLGRDEIDEKSLIGLRGVIKISHTVVNGTCLLSLDGFAPAVQWEQLSSTSPATLAVWEGSKVTYSYTQISQYITCPRRYRHRYLDGWHEKDTRAVMLFGRAFEQALCAYFLREDAAAVLFREWSRCQNQGLHYSKGDSWDRMLQQGIQLLDRFCQDDRIRIRQPRRNLQIKFTRPVSKNNDFVAYVDAIGKLDGERCLIEWKTTSSRYSEEPDGLLALDPQLVCYSWMTGIPEVAQVVFVRKRLVEVQYLRTVIADEQHGEFGQLVEDTIRRVEAAQFLPHSGIRFPQNPCSSCPYVGLCLGKPKLINIALERRPGAENLGWLDELGY